MARIVVAGLAVAAGVGIGFLTGNPMIGLSVFSTIESIGNALIPKNTPAYQPLNDLQVQSAAAGMPIPYGFGSYRVAGEVIAAQTIQYHKHKQSTGGKGGGGGKSQTVYTYTLTAAIAFGAGPGTVTRIWADSKLVYDATGKGPIAINTGLSNSSGVAQTTPFRPVIYTGTTTQNPDPTLQAIFGVNSTPAFRGVIYMVLNNFPLADFGNRCPNFRAEIVNSVQQSFISELYPRFTIAEPLSGQISAISRMYVDPRNRAAFYIGSQTQSFKRIDVDVTAGTPADPFANNTLYHLGDQILDSNGNIQLCIRQHTSQSSGHPAWQTGLSAITQVSGQNTWQNLGPGPDTVPVTSESLASFRGTQVGSITQQEASIVDSAGYLWVQPTFSDVLTHLIKLDPRTFTQLADVKFPTGILNVISWQVLKSAASGRDYLIGISGDSIVALDTNNNSFVSVGSWNPGGLHHTNSGGNEAPVAVDPNSGLVYMTAYAIGGGSVLTTHLLTIDLRSGIPVILENIALSNAGWQTLPTNEWCPACIFDTDDSTCILISQQGAVLKVDPTNGNIITFVKNLSFSGQDIPSLTVKGYQGIIPGDGVIKLVDSTLTSFKYVRASDLSVLQTVNISNWLPSFGTTLEDLQYEPVSNSMFLSTGTFGPYSGLLCRIFFDRQATAETDLPTVLSTLWAKTGADASLLDTSLVGSLNVRGYVIANITPMKNILQPLCQALFFDMVESNNLMRAVPRGQGVTTVIPETDLGIVEDNYTAQPHIMQEYDLPLSMMVNYYDPALDYQMMKQMYKRNKKVKKTRNETQISLPITLTSIEAAQIAARALSIVWAERVQWEFKTYRGVYAMVDPTDVVQFTYNGNPYQARVTKMSAGQNLVVQFQALSEDPREYTKTATGNSDTGFIESTLVPVGPTILFVLDTPYISDQDCAAAGIGLTGYYWLVSSPSASRWTGAQLYQSNDNNTYNLIGVDTIEATFGVVQSGPTPEPENLFSWDYDTQITVRLTQGTLASDTDLNVLNGSNMFYLGGELMAFANAVLNSDGTYTISRLLRGLRGTEFWTRYHQQSEIFVLLSGQNAQHQATPSSFINQLQYFKGITIGQPVTSTAPNQVTLKGNDLKPYAPAQLTGIADSAGNLAVSWERRTRIGGSWQDGTGDVPLSEQNENYDVEIMWLNLQGRGPDTDPHYVYASTNGPNNPQKPFLRLDQYGVPPNPIVYQFDILVPPFSLTWDDGVAAQYKGGLIQAPSPNSVPALTPTFIWVHDPNRTGDQNGGTVTYGYDSPSFSDNTIANQTGYFLIAVLGAFVMGVPQTSIPITVGGDFAVRTYTAMPTKNLTYPAQQQVTDFGRDQFTAVSAPGFVRVRAYQNSGLVGRGFATTNPKTGFTGKVVSGSSDATSILGVNIRTVNLVDGSILQYNAANNTWDIIGPMLKRQTISVTTSSLLAGGSASITLNVGCRSFVLLSVEVSDMARVQLYETSAFRTADSGRGANSLPAAASENGIIVDESFYAGGDETRVMSSPLLGSNMDSPTAQQVYAVITNNTGSTTPITAKFVIIPIEN